VSWEAALSPLLCQHFDFNARFRQAPGEPEDLPLLRQESGDGLFLELALAHHFVKHLPLVLEVAGEVDKRGLPFRRGLPNLVAESLPLGSIRDETGSYFDEVGADAEGIDEIDIPPADAEFRENSCFGRTGVVNVLLITQAACDVTADSGAYIKDRSDLSLVNVGLAYRSASFLLADRPATPCHISRLIFVGMRKLEHEPQQDLIQRLERGAT
jgi:hypothetical protein